VRICVDCGQEIPLARLKAIPETTLCRECREKDDVPPFQPDPSLLVERGQLDPGEVEQMIHFKP
jgi:hypothetical protein